MFDTPDIVSPTLICGIIVLITLGLAFLSGFIPAIKLIRKDTEGHLRKRLSLSVAAMSIGALGIVFLCVLLAQTTVTNTWNLSHQLDGAICSETRISSQYKLMLTQFRDNTASAELVSVDGKMKIPAIEQYAITGNLVTGKTHHNFFWFDLNTGAYRYLDDTGRFFESLKLLGISQPADLLPLNTLCKTWNCKPCTR
jgi:hypothetical protein